jgi:hypothetical protein
MRRPPAHPKDRTVRRRFEPNRLAPEYLAAAYEQVIPFSRRRRGAAPDAAGAKQPRKEAA